MTQDPIFRSENDCDPNFSYLCEFAPTHNLKLAVNHRAVSYIWQEQCNWTEYASAGMWHHRVMGFFFVPVQ